MEDRIPTSVLSIIKASQEKGEKLTTLRCRMTGTFKPFTNAIIFPLERRFQVKDIELIDGDIYNVKVKGLPFKNCTPFSIITPEDLKVKYDKRGYFLPVNFHSKDFFPGDYYITGGIFSGYRPFNREKHSAKVKKLNNLYCVNFPFKTPLVPGAIYCFENSKGFKGDMVLIYPGDLSKKSENIINSRVEKFRSRPSIKGIYSIMLRTDNYVELPYFLKDQEFAGSIKMNNVRIMEREYHSVKNKIMKQSKASGGVLFNDLKKSCKVTPAFFHRVIDQLDQAEDITIQEDYIVYNGEDRKNNLSPLITEAGDNGFSSRELKDPGSMNCFSQIKRMNLATVLDEDLYYSPTGYSELLNKIFKSRNIGDSLTIQDIRESAGLSRRYIISLLKNLEEQEFIIREYSDERVIKKIP